MITSRIIPVLLHRGRQLVKGKAFHSWRSVGLVDQAVRVHQQRGVDELILLDVDRDPPSGDFIREITHDCFMPLTIGGGVGSLDDVKTLMRNGADKVSFSTEAVYSFATLKEVATHFGAQAVVVCIDYDKNGYVHVNCGSEMTLWDAPTWARHVAKHGAGEIILQSIERDGMMQGYDLKMIERVARDVSIPVVAAGGCGTYDHMAEALRAGADAVAAGAMFLFTDSTPLGAARHLAGLGFNVRTAQ